MPTYEYRCHFCNRLSDAFQKMSDPPLITCPYCGKDGLERVVSGGAGVIYKGEGWYVTDYSKKSSGGKDSPSSTSTSTKADAKPTGSGSSENTSSAGSSSSTAS